jgi:hypothetical protein
MTVEAPAPVCLSSDPWLGERLGVEAWRLEAGGPIEEIDRALAGIEAPAFVEARVPPAAVDRIEHLTARGMRLVDTSVVLERPPLGHESPSVEAELRAARRGDLDGVVALARSSFIFSRFHLDPYIDGAVADEIKAQWAANYFRGERGDGLGG